MQRTTAAVERMTEVEALEAWDRLLDELESRALDTIDPADYLEDSEEEREYALLSRRIRGYCRMCGAEAPAPCDSECVTNVTESVPANDIITNV
jgi:hypothetical protein